MSDDTCAIEECGKPRYQRRPWCGSHTMKIHRYGDPHYKAAPRFEDLTGRRFGLLEVVSREKPGWLCRCDCGEMTVALVGDLNRGSKISCGDRRHTRREDAGYAAAHGRVRHERGSASAYRCVDCGSRAYHWSYNHRDPEEMVSDGDRAGLPYSLDTSFYEARCVPCHKVFDLGRTLLIG